MLEGQFLGFQPLQLMEGLLKPVRYVSPTTSLLHFEGTNGSTTFTDSAQRPLTWTRGGSTAISTAQFKIGAASGSWTTSSDYLYCNDATAFVAPYEFTIEMWVRPASFSVTRTLFDTRPTDSTTTGFWATHTTSGTINVTVNVSGTETSRFTSSAMTINTWNHIALCRASDTLRFFLNGVSQGTPYTETVRPTTQTMTLGCWVDQRATTNNHYNGFMDEFRFSKIARYTANFTPSTTAFTPA